MKRETAARHVGEQHNEWEMLKAEIQAMGVNLRDNAERESTSGSTGR